MSSTHSVQSGTKAGRTTRKTLPLIGIVITNYREGARWRPNVISAGQAVMALLELTPAAQFKPETALDALVKGAEKAVTLKGKRGEADEAALSILKRFS